MRRLFVFLLVVGIAASSALCATGSEAVASESSDSGTFTVDAQDPSTWPPGSATVVEAVQSAVDEYEVVYLVGAFDFGNSSVFVSRSVEIVGGGTDTHGTYRTRILGGGLGAFASHADPTAEIVFRDIEWDGAETALFVTASSGVEVTGCRIRNITAPWGGFGVYLSGSNVTGEAIIRDSHFDVSSPGGWSAGVFAQSIFADVEVLDNVVENFNVTGIWVNSAGDIKVEDNRIIAGSASPSIIYRNGILVGSWWLPSGDRGDIRVTDNTIITGGHISDAGIATEDFEQEERDVCRIADNEIAYVGDSTDGHGILLLSYFSNCKFKDNAVDGDGHELGSGIALFPAVDPSSIGGEQTGHTFLGNRIRDARVRLAGVFVHSSAFAQDNRFIENKLEAINGIGLVIDGDRNQFIENKLEEIGGDGFHLLGDYNLLSDNDYDDIDGQCVVDMGVGNRIRGENCDDD